MDCSGFLAVQGTLKSLFQHHSSKTSISWHSAFFLVQLSHPYITIGKTTALTRWTFVRKIMSLLFNALCRFVIVFLRRSKCLWGNKYRLVCSEVSTFWRMPSLWWLMISGYHLHRKGWTLSTKDFLPQIIWVSFRIYNCLSSSYTCYIYVFCHVWFFNRQFFTAVLSLQQYLAEVRDFPPPTHV